MKLTDPPHALRLTPHSMNTTVLAFDFGEIRIGAAVGDIAIGIAHPLTTIHAADKKRRFAALDKLVQEWQPARLVVGLPVELVDERLTSAAAESSMAEAGVVSRKRKPLIDQVAAQHILQAYLDASAFHEDAHPA